jgi:hypothetical protein
VKVGGSKSFGVYGAVLSCIRADVAQKTDCYMT